MKNTIFSRKLVKEMEIEERYFNIFNDNDLAEIVDVYINVFSAEPWNDELTHKQITNYVNQMVRLNTFKGYTVREKSTNKLLGAALGFIRPWYMGKEYHLDSFFVSNDYQGKGIGTQFLRFIKEQLESINIPTIILDTDRGYPAESFYLRNGFKTSNSSIILFGDTTSSF